MKGKNRGDPELAATSSLLLEKSEAMPCWAAAASWYSLWAQGDGVRYGVFACVAVQ